MLKRYQLTILTICSLFIPASTLHPMLGAARTRIAVAAAQSVNHIRVTNSSASHSRSLSDLTVPVHIGLGIIVIGAVVTAQIIDSETYEEWTEPKRQKIYEEKLAHVYEKVKARRISCIEKCPSDEWNCPDYCWRSFQATVDILNSYRINANNNKKFKKWFNEYLDSEEAVTARYPRSGARS